MEFYRISVEIFNCAMLPVIEWANALSFVDVQIS